MGNRLKTMFGIHGMTEFDENLPCCSLDSTSHNNYNYQGFPEMTGGTNISISAIISASCVLVDDSDHYNLSRHSQLPPTSYPTQTWPITCNQEYSSNRHQNGGKAEQAVCGYQFENNQRNYQFCDFNDNNFDCERSKIWREDMDLLTNVPDIQRTEGQTWEDENIHHNFNRYTPDLVPRSGREIVDLYEDYSDVGRNIPSIWRELSDGVNLNDSNDNPAYTNINCKNQTTENFTKPDSSSDQPIAATHQPEKQQPDSDALVAQGNFEIDVDHMLSNGVTVAGYKPRPIIRKKKKKPVVTDQKDISYWSRRMKNNDSARKSREAKKEKERVFYKQALQLEYENYFLKERILQLESQLGFQPSSPPTTNNLTCTQQLDF